LTTRGSKACAGSGRALEDLPLVHARDVERDALELVTLGSGPRAVTASGFGAPPPVAIAAAVSAARFMASQSSRSV